MSATGVAVEDLLARLRASVAERRASGQYPPNLEEDLDAHFQRIISSRTQMPGLATLRRRIELVRRASRFSPDRIPTSTRLPGGAVLHKGMSRLFLRQAHGILLQVQEFADRTIEALEAVTALADSPDNHQHVDLVERIDAHTEALAGATLGQRRGTGPEPDLLGDYHRRLEALEQAEAARRWRPWFGRDRFDAVFDHGREHHLSEATVAALGDRAPIVDLSTDPALDRDANPISSLATRADASLGGVVAVRADELLTAQQIVDLVAVAFERLAVDGRLIVSCGAPPPFGPRPSFDPTLGPTLPSQYVAFVCREAGFASVELQEWPEVGYLVVATR